MEWSSLQVPVTTSAVAYYNFHQQNTARALSHHFDLSEQKILAQDVDQIFMVAFFVTKLDLSVTKIDRFQLLIVSSRPSGGISRFTKAITFLSPRTVVRAISINNTEAYSSTTTAG